MYADQRRKTKNCMHIVRELVSNSYLCYAMNMELLYLANVMF